MFCENCGSQLIGNENVCPYCGTVLANGQQNQQPMENQPFQAEPNTWESAPNSTSYSYEEPATAVGSQMQGNFCPACGTPNHQNQRFCEVCGTPLDQTGYETNPTQQTAEPVPAEPVVAGGKPPRKKGKKTALIVIGAIVLVLAATVGVFAAAIANDWWPPVTNWYHKTFSSPEDYLNYVVGRSKNDVTGDIAKSLSNVKDPFVNGVSASADIEITLGDQFAPMIEDFTGTDISSEIYWIETIGVSAKSSMKGSQVKASESFRLNGTELFDLAYMVDYYDGEMYIGIPSYQPQYLKVSPEMTYSEQQQMQQSFEAMQTVLDALPDEATMQDILNRYFQCVTTSVGPVTKAESSISAGDISQNVTVLTADISAQDALNIARSVLSELKNDTAIKEFIGKLSDLTGISESEFESAIAEAESALNNTSNVPDTTVMTVSFYVDADGNLVGFDINMEGESICYYTTTNGNQIGVKFQMSFPSGGMSTKLEFSGKGTKADGKITGDYSIKAMGMDIASFHVENFAEDGSCGTISMRISDMITGMLPAPASKLSKASIEYTWASVSETEGTEELALYYNDGLAVSLKGTSKQLPFEPINTPSNTITIDPNSTSDREILEWIEGFDSGKLITNLRNAQVPSQFVDALETLFLQASMPEPLTVEEWLTELPPEYLEEYTSDELAEAYLYYLERYEASNGTLSPDELFMLPDEM